MNSEEMCIWPGCVTPFIEGTQQISDGRSFLCAEHSKEFEDSWSWFYPVFQQLAAIKDELDL